MNLFNKVQYIYIGLHIWKMHESMVRQIMTQLAGFMIRSISCSSDVPEAHKQYIQYQILRHSRTYCIGNTHKCRFYFPIPPVSKTVILEPIDFESEQKKTSLRQNGQIHKHLNQYGLAFEIKITYDELLVELEMS